MYSFRFLVVLILLFSAAGCSQKQNTDKLSRLKELSEKSGIEMIVIDEAEKITQAEAARFKRHILISSFTDDPVSSTIVQQSPKERTVELPGVSFLVGHKVCEDNVTTINNKFAYRGYMAFISNSDTRDDSLQTISIIQSTDKFNILRLQQTHGGSHLFGTERLIELLQEFDKKYPFSFIGAGEDWVLLQTNSLPRDWSTFAKDILPICPTEDLITLEEYAEVLSRAKGRVSMWWD